MTEEREKEILHCRRLGHDVPFGYCLREGGDRPCRLVFDCWWERFDVQSFLRDRLPEDLYLSLLHIVNAAKAPSWAGPPASQAIFRSLKPIKRRGKPGPSIRRPGRS